MRPRYIFILAIVVLSITSCADSYTATEYNTFIVNKQAALDLYLNASTAEIGRVEREGKADSVIYLYKQMMKKIDEQIDALNTGKLPDAKNAAPFRDAAIKYFSMPREVCNVYIKYRQDLTLPDSIVYQGLEKAFASRNKAFEWLQYAQKKFAYDNGVEMQKDPFGKD